MDSYTQGFYYQHVIKPLLIKIKPLPPSPPSEESKSQESKSQESKSETEYRSFFRDTMNPPYSHLEKAIVHSVNLRNKKTIDYYKNKGLQWLTRHDIRKFPTMLRNPYLGCMVELSSKPSLYTVHIDSKEAKKIINRDCYF